MRTFIVFQLDCEKAGDFSSNEAVILTPEPIENMMNLTTFCIVCIVEKVDGSIIDFKTNKTHFEKQEFKNNKAKFEVGIVWNIVRLTNLSTYMREYHALKSFNEDT